MYKLLNGRTIYETEEVDSSIAEARETADTALETAHSALDITADALRITGVAVNKADAANETAIIAKSTATNAQVTADLAITIANSNVASVNNILPDENGNVTLPLTDGTVKSVNENLPDENGNVTLPITAGTVTSVNENLPNENGNVTLDLDHYNMHSAAFMAQVPCRLSTPDVYGKKRYIVSIYQVPKNILLTDGYACFIRISWYKIISGDVTTSSKLFSLPQAHEVGVDYDTNINLDIGRYYVEIENLGYNL